METYMQAVESRHVYHKTEGHNPFVNQVSLNVENDQLY